MAANPIPLQFPGTIKKVCRQCHEEKTLSDYYYVKESVDGHAHICKKCSASNAREWYRTHHKRALKTRRGYYKKHKEREKENWKRYYEKHRKRLTQSAKEYVMKRKFGMTVAAYERMLVGQMGVCAICHKGPGRYPRLAVDHCHKTGKVRALLCGSCNGGLGLFKDREDVMLAAVEYLRKHNASN